MKYYFNPHARLELREATLHFDDIDPALGKGFRGRSRASDFAGLAISRSLAPGHSLSSSLPHTEISVRPPLSDLERTDRDRSGDAFIS